MKPEEVIAKQLEYYNDRDLVNFCGLFADDVRAYSFPNWEEPILKGIEELQNRYQNRFETSPNLHSTVEKRISLNEIVIDDEYIVGINNDAPIRIIAIYEVKGHKITRIWFIYGEKDKTIEEPIDHQLKGYNSRDIDVFMEAYHTNCTIYTMQTGEQILGGEAEMWERYGKLFQENEGLNANVLSRIQLGNYVIDYEEVTGISDDGLVYVFAINEIENGKIKRVWFCR